MKALLFTSAAVVASMAAANAQSDNPQTLQNVQATGSEMVAQSGDYADRLKQILETIRLPSGFKIELYAIVPDARHMAVGQQGTVTFVSTGKDRVWAVTDRNKDGVADEVKRFAPSIDLVIPHGVCFAKDGTLFLVERNRVLKFPDAESSYEGVEMAVSVVVPQGELIPPDEESRGHSARVCDIGPDDKLYVSLGQPYNVPPPRKAEKYWEWGIGGIIRMDRDGFNREVYVRGIRNSVGQDFDPATGELWFTDNQVDGMGDDIPPGELNHITGPGQHFGFPWFGGGSTRTNEYKNSDPPGDAVPPVVEFIAHAADLGMMFYTGDQFPAKYRGGIFSAQHGSWNRTEPVGARVMFTTVNEDGTATTEPFAEGWLQSSGGYSGRPVDVAQLPDGSILVSDDLAGALYRISYGM